MDKVKLSPWHEAGTKPVRVGVYEVDRSFPAFAYWDGSKFCYRCYSPYLTEEILSKWAIKRAYNKRGDETFLDELTTWIEILK